MRNNYIIQPYKVGSKNSKSLAIVIPLDIRKKLQIDTSTVFILKSSNNKCISLSIADIENNKNEWIPVDKNSFEGYKSTGIHY